MDRSTRFLISRAAGAAIDRLVPAAAGAVRAPRSARVRGRRADLRDAPARGCPRRGARSAPGSPGRCPRLAGRSRGRADRRVGGGALAPPPRRPSPPRTSWSRRWSTASGPATATPSPNRSRPAPDVRRSPVGRCCCPTFARRSRYTGAPAATCPTATPACATASTSGSGPTCPTTPVRPVLLQVHGGAWVMGQKEGQAHPLMAHLADRGWVCVTINYRLSPRATWPDQIVDVKRAIAWIRAHIAEPRRRSRLPRHHRRLGRRPPGRARRADPRPAAFQPGFEDADTRVAAAVPFYGVYDFTNRHGDANPELRAPAEPQRAQDHARRRPRRLGPGLAHEPRAAGRPAVLPAPRHQRHDRAGRAGPRLRRRCWARRPTSRSSTPSCPGPSTRSTPCRRCGRTNCSYAVERFLAVVRSRHGGATPAEAVAVERA